MEIDSDDSDAEEMRRINAEEVDSDIESSADPEPKKQSAKQSAKQRDFQTLTKVVKIIDI